MLQLTRKCFDNRSDLQRIANDRNITLVGHGLDWMAFDADGCVLATGSHPVTTLSSAIFGVN